VAGLSARLGIFGGTFDPPHIGHLILAAEAKAQLSLDRVLWVLTPHPPHKTNLRITTIEHRLALLQAGIGHDPGFEISRVDIDRPPPHFAVDTMRLLHIQHPSAKLVYLMGSDSLDDLPIWHDPQEFVRQIDELGVMCRPGRELDLGELAVLFPGLSERVRILSAPLLEISSTNLRQKIAAGGAYQYYFPAPVLELIDRLNLYRALNQ
jgi:nicotinate-nucleotide adenylyltransferase